MIHNERKDLVVAPEGMTHLLENLGADANPRQMIRELTQNSIDAIGRRPGPGKILWTPDRKQPSKLTLIDNGDGMTGEEMVAYINRLSSSASHTSLTDHFGVGAKITAGVRNPHGLVYESWKNGRGARIVFWKDPSTGRYGLKLLKRHDGSMGLWSDIMMSEKPTHIITQNGTKVTLMGSKEDDNTTVAPSNGSEFVGPDWIARYLGSRYGQLPVGIDLRVSTKPTYDFTAAQVVKPRLNYLNENAQHYGTVQLADVRAHWWILKSVRANTLVEDKGHVGVIFQNELYDMAFSRKGAVLLNHAGVVAGPDRVVLYFEPISKQGNFVKASTARNGLRVESEQPPIVEWALAFAEETPEEIRAYVEKLMEEAPEDSAKRLESRLRRLSPLFASTAFRSSYKGNLDLVSGTNGTQKPPIKGPNNNQSGSSETPNPRSLANRLRLRMEGERSNQKGSRTSDLTVPEISWVDGKHDEQLRDCAAKYDANNNRLIINEDFRGFKDFLAHMRNEYIDPGKTNKSSKKTEALLTATVKDYFAQALAESVLGILNLSKRGAFLPEQYITDYLTPQALTVAAQIKIEMRNNVAQAMRNAGYRMRATEDDRSPQP